MEELSIDQITCRNRPKFVRLLAISQTKTCIISMYYFYRQFHVRMHFIVWCIIFILNPRRRLFGNFVLEHLLNCMMFKGARHAENMGAKQIRLKTHAGLKLDGQNNSSCTKTCRIGWIWPLFLLWSKCSFLSWSSWCRRSRSRSSWSGCTWNGSK